MQGNHAKLIQSFHWSFSAGRFQLFEKGRERVEHRLSSCLGSGASGRRQSCTRGEQLTRSHPLKPLRIVRREGRDTLLGWAERQISPVDRCYKPTLREHWRVTTKMTNH